MGLRQPEMRTTASVAPYARMVRWSGGQREDKLTYHVKRTIRSYGTQKQTEEKSNKRTRGL